MDICSDVYHGLWEDSLLHHGPLHRLISDSTPLLSVMCFTSTDFQVLLPFALGRPDQIHYFQESVNSSEQRSQETDRELVSLQTALLLFFWELPSNTGEGTVRMQLEQSMAVKKKKKKDLV